VTALESSPGQTVQKLLYSPLFKGGIKSQIRARILNKKVSMALLTAAT
jgi:hypothetical protein